MVHGLVTATEVGLLTLLALLAARMVSLSRSDLLVPASADNVTGQKATRSGVSQGIAPPDRTELFSQLHILAGLQERDCRVNGLILTDAPQAVQTYAAAWLYGASCALSPKPVRHSEALAGMAAGIVSRKTGIRQAEALQAISTLTQSSVLLACYRAGLEGAEFWQANRHVPACSALYEVVTSNAFI
ncbi:hypothetical protein [Marinobacter daepoensis]|uniref:hypothetical protein n=1 Tax=Marinobacter daepoensis TaxID=262077 RepID=UPI0004091A50|nr:hypothetical protein [Marinobacter daepoensis]